MKGLFKPLHCLLALPLLLLGLSVCAQDSDVGKPNIILILTDDLGYADIGCFGGKIETPHLDRMAEQGTRLTSFYASPVCSPTRASLMTGCLPQRVGIGGVMFPRNNHGLNPDEITLPELLKQQGYATALIGKWHLGNQDLFQPLNHGFDYWYGTPASNSQFFDPKLKALADDCVLREGYRRETILDRERANCPLVRNNIAIEVPADQSLLTQRYTQEAIRFMNRHDDKPFFIYLAHNMPHIPLHASESFAGKSKHGAYGDVIQELDWSTGEILKAIKQLGIDKNTLVLFTSDNGPNLSKGGRAAPLRGGKGSTYEGGVRVPFIAHWPGRVAAGQQTDEPGTVMDMLPALVALLGGQAPDDRAIDGKNILPLLSGAEGAKSPHQAIYYPRGNALQAIRVGEWKYRLAKDKIPGIDGGQIVEGLYNLHDDIGETTNLIDEQPQIVARLKKQLKSANDELKQNKRPAGNAVADEAE